MITSHWHIVVSPHTYCGMVSVHMHLAPFPGLHASFCYCTNSKWQKLSGKVWERDRNWVGRLGYILN